ncbi:GTP-binding protein 1 [Schizopora paradoxa]|uniref:GTP-binding protein 1 n=1 Tax=Schizopora paradoxa TaxID=27342 RepID=A0A0H2RRH8_9AGAM|nr:GTP-binding protein 1 [Schizopora paradoxa]
MTTLRSFQDEIENIHARETAKQRAIANATATSSVASTSIRNDSHRRDHPDKENRRPPLPTADAAGPAIDGSELAKQHPPAEADFDPEDDRRLQELLLTDRKDDYSAARDIIAGLLTRNRGECLVRLGAHPPHPALFSGELNGATESDEWIGVHRTKDEMETLCARITRATEEVGGKVATLYPFSGDRLRTTLLLRLPPQSVEATPEVRVAVVGNVDSGKSTTLGVLTRGGLDDGRGRARVTLFRHKHEIETGRTSSVGMEILGFAPTGEPILPASLQLPVASPNGSKETETGRREKLGWEEIAIQSAKVVSFIDLAGHEKYLKTTLYGLTSGAPSCVMLMVGGNAGLIGMSKEHLAISLALNVPVIVCITKIDMTPANVLAETVKQVVKILKSPGCRKTPVFVKSLEASVELSQTFAKERLCPIFQLSNVTGEGLDFLRTFLNLLPSSEGDTAKFAADQPLEYSVTEVWSVPYVGTVVNGIMNAGHVNAGDAIFLGPDENGNWHTSAIKSIQRKRAPVGSADAGQCVSFALKRMRRNAVRKGMVIVAKTEVPPKATRRFMGQVLILYHNTTLQKGYQAMLHCGAVRQTVRIVNMDNPNGVLRTGDRATVEFEFISHPEFIKEGMKLLFREGKTKGLGVITELL